MSTSVTVNLEYPVEYGNEVISEVTLRRPIGRDVRKLIPIDIMTVNFEDGLALAARCMGKTKEFVELLDVKDCMRIVGEIYHFFGVTTGPQKTERNSQ
jgi:hypothetical protein